MLCFSEKSERDVGSIAVHHADIEHTIEAGGLAELHQRRDAAYAHGRVYGIGYAAVVELSISEAAPRP